MICQPCINAATEKKAVFYLEKVLKLLVTCDNEKCTKAAVFVAKALKEIQDD